MDRRFAYFVRWSVAKKLLLLALVLTGVATPFGKSGSQTILLQQGDRVTREIDRDETQRIGVDLSAGQYAEIAFDWQGINLAVAVLDPDGKKLLPSDVQVSANGPVVVSILAERAGTYSVQVRALVQQKIRGKYQLKLEEPRLPSATDRSRLAAQNLIAKGQTSPTSEKLDSFKQALALLEEASDLNGAARTLIYIGDVYKGVRDPVNAKASYVNAKASYERAAAIWNRSGYQRGEAYARIALGSLKRSLDSSEDAIADYQQAQLLFAQIGDQRGQADALFGQAFALMNISQIPQAIAVLQQTIQLRRLAEDHIGEAGALNMLADAYRSLGDIDRSLASYNEATNALAGLEHRSLEATLINNRALVLDDQGFWEQARTEYARALTAYESILGRPVMDACSNPSAADASLCSSSALALDDLGQVFDSLEQPDRGLVELNKALTIGDALRQPRIQGLARLHIGYTYALMAEPAKPALSFYNEALPYLQKAGDKASVALTYTYMGRVYTSTGDLTTALGFYQKALTTQETAGDKRGLAIIVDNLGTGYQATGNATQALKNYRRALDLWREVKDPDGEALTLYNMARTERAVGELATANQHADGSLKLIESLRKRITSERSRTSYLARRQEYYELGIDLKMQLSKSIEAYAAAAIEASEEARARVLLDALSEARLGRETNDHSPGSRLARLLNQQEGIAQKFETKSLAQTRILAGNHTPAQVATMEKDLAEITGRMDDLAGQIKAENPRFAALTKPRPATLKEIQAEIDPDTILLEYALGDQRSYVWVVSSDSIKGFELGPRKEIEETARRLTRSITDTRPEVKDPVERRRRIDQARIDYAESSVALSKMILEPVARLLGNKRLVIVADGALQMVPFQALPAPSSAGFSGSLTLSSKQSTDNSKILRSRQLIEDHEIVYEPSASVLALQRSELANRKPALLAVAVLADAVYSSDDARVSTAIARQSSGATRTGKGPVIQTLQKPVIARNDLTRALDDIGLKGFQPLQHSEEEAQAIMDAAPRGQGMAALGFQANRATAMNPDLSKYRVVHFSTHGVVDFNHPELSGLVLSLVDESGQPQDGYLRLHDIYNLNLPAELVVLSACQTGVGKEIKGEGLIALTRGFIYAGAARVVATLWKVDDATTADLMAEFYRQMFTNKLKPAAALRAAQITMARTREPYFWAGFVLQGEWK